MILDFNTLNRLFELECEEHDRESDGDDVRDRLGCVDAKSLIREELRHDIDKRQKQYEFPHDRDRNR